MKVETWGGSLGIGTRNLRATIEIGDLHDYGGALSHWIMLLLFCLSKACFHR